MDQGRQVVFFQSWLAHHQHRSAGRIVGRLTQLLAEFAGVATAAQHAPPGFEYPVGG